MNLRQLRYLAGSVAVTIALSLVSFAQQAAPAQGGQQAAKPAVQEWPAEKAAMMVAEWARARNWTKAYIDAMPEEGLNFKPVPEVRTFAEQMLHLASANFAYAMFGAGKQNPYKREDFAPEKFKNRADLNKMVAESYDFMIAAIKSLDAAKMDEKITMRNTSLTRTAVLHNAFEHQTHHRGQTTIYLRMKGATPPPEPFN